MKKKSDSSTSSEESVVSGSGLREQIRVYDQQNKRWKKDNLVGTLCAEGLKRQNRGFLVLDVNPKEPIKVFDVYNQRMRKTGDVGALRPNFTKGSRSGFLVSGTATTTSTQSQSTIKTSGKNIVQQTLGGLKQISYQTLICSVQDFLAKLSQSQGSAKDSMIREELSFLKSQGFSKTKDPDIYYSKMLKVYLVTKMEKLSRQYLKFSPTLGIFCNGKFSIVRTSECHRIGKECSLSDILEKDPDKKYFLSEKMVRYIKEKMHHKVPVSEVPYEDGAINQ